MVSGDLIEVYIVDFPIFLNWLRIGVYQRGKKKKTLQGNHFTPLIIHSARLMFTNIRIRGFPLHVLLNLVTELQVLNLFKKLCNK